MHPRILSELALSDTLYEATGAIVEVTIRTDRELTVSGPRSDVEAAALALLQVSATIEEMLHDDRETFAYVLLPGPVPPAGR